MFHRFCFVEFVSFCSCLFFCDCNRTFVQIHVDTSKVKAEVAQFNKAAEFSTLDSPPALPTDPESDGAVPSLRRLTFTVSF